MYIVQVALLLTLDAMSELSVVREDNGTRLRDTHIGCSPLDGFVAYRQRLECPSCNTQEAAAESLDRSISFLVKVHLFLCAVSRIVKFRDNGIVQMTFDRSPRTLRPTFPFGWDKLSSLVSK